MSDFLKALHSGKVLLMDGAMGTELQRAGIGDGECYELWNLTHPEKVRAIHQAYVEVGAEILLTNTFQANPFALGSRESDMEAIIRTGIDLARSVGGKSRFVLGDIGPFPAPVESADEHVFLHHLLRVLKSFAGADGVLFETWSNANLLNYLKPIAEAQDLPLFISFTYRSGLQSRRYYLDSGLEPGDLSWEGDVAALGVNCGPNISMDDIDEIIRRYHSTTDLPLFARPNAGTPSRIDNRWEYPRTPERMAERLPKLLEAGVSMFGGCCGTTPEHIAAFRPIIDKWNARK